MKRSSSALALACVLTLGCREERAPAVVAEPAAPAVSRVEGSATIVVLGSSTAAGVGPRDRRHAWAERYRQHLSQHYPGYQLVNLAVGGYTTYHVQATGFAPPAGRPSPDAARNISAALGLAPRAVIVNLPSNDAAESIPAAEQLANYERLAKLANGARVALWVTTTQPRRLSSEQTASQTEVRDAVLARFVPYALDFWTPFAGERGQIKPEYDAGDGVHLNDAAHAILAAEVVRARIPERSLP